MILQSPAKINIGLQILRKRTDGYHDLSSLMLPLAFHDLVEIVPGKSGDEPFLYSSSGIEIKGKLESNLCHKAWKKYTEYKGSVPIHIHLHKQIPFGAGLGGGSSNAATILKGLNTLNGTPFTNIELKQLAAEIGSDCALFIENKPSLAGGRGEILTDFKHELQAYYMVLLFPGFGVSTQEAYSSVLVNENVKELSALLIAPIENWKDVILNDFEKSVFKIYPEISSIKDKLYSAGAIYASMSGSGSAVYGIFNRKPSLPKSLLKYRVWEGSL